ncbi:hypothetical protein GCM10025331_86920 [Actinoplanes utahensis]|nr:hypothetical protein Aut01nite_86610 [Actinoplanes utahensis]
MIDRAFREQRSWAPGRGAGDETDFFFVEGGLIPSRQAPNSTLMVRVNASTGLGALIWFVNTLRADASGRQDDQWIWVTDNADPADDDPLVAAEPHELIGVGPSVVLPVAEIRAAVEEYCRAGTGERPGSVSWVHGNNLGERDDRQWKPPDYSDERVAQIAPYPEKIRALAALQLYRMLPVVEAARAAFAGAARQILDACQAGTTAPESAIATVQPFADVEGPVVGPGWFLWSLGFEVAQLSLLAAGAGPASNPAGSVVIGTSNFWHTCNRLLCFGETATDWDLVTTFRRIEDNGRRQEFEKVLATHDPAAVMRRDLATWAEQRPLLDTVGLAVARAAA